RAAGDSRRAGRARRPEADRGRGPDARAHAAAAGRHDIQTDRALVRARHRRVRRETGGVSRTHPARRLGGAGARVAPEQVRRAGVTRPATVPRAASHALSHAFLPIAILTLVWGCNWPVLKLGVTEIP